MGKAFELNRERQVHGPYSIHKLFPAIIDPNNGAQQKAWDQACWRSQLARQGWWWFFSSSLSQTTPCLRRLDANVVYLSLALTDVGAGAINFVSLHDHLHVTVSDLHYDSVCLHHSEMVFSANHAYSDYPTTRACSFQAA